MKKDLFKLVAVGFVFCSLGAQAQTITYQLDRTIGLGTVSGFIETNGTIGPLDPTDIVSWSLEADDGSGEHSPITIGSASGGGLTGAGWDFFSATESELLFDFEKAFDFASANELFADVQFFGDGGAMFEGINYGFAASPVDDFGEKENLTHFFPGGIHYVESLRGLVVVIGTTNEPTVYDYQFLDNPGTVETQVFGINEKGDVVGNGVNTPDAFPFVYSINHNTLTPVAEVVPSIDTAVLDISSRGVMVGSVESLDSLTTSGFMRDKDGVFTFFSHPDNTVGAVCRTLPRGVNANGLISGYYRYCDDNIEETVGFIYDPKNETFTDIIPSLLTIAQGINNAGDVVGNATYSHADDPCDSPISNRYGWLRTADGSVTYFQVNGERTDARGIDDDGFIVGAIRDSVSREFKGFKIKLAGGSSCESVTVAESDLLVFPGQIWTIPEGISNSGIIVGITRDELGLRHGFIATPQ